ncbi:MAG: hypothetical protein N3G80_04105 [Candidatus Micrarchaeota archaeon]|nr:hypothetical protein [Candidatus Micrarchaeota archaeon]
MKSTFIKAKPASIVLLLKDTNQVWYPSKLARGANCSYVYVVSVLQKLSKFGVVAAEKKGKQKYYRLTEKGLQLALLLDEFVKRCDSISAEAKPSQPSAQQQ